ncbi:hypothetical protein [Halorubrum distributum]|uniref:hypothetical protein n=1 Tax=Halorubrum distributum TaxID=29283 RepID=UPI00193AD082|nr:hypothetical protein [Halorubrum terrestre]
MANAAVYAMVSTRDQELDTQRDNLLDYADDLGLDVDADHVLVDKLTEETVSALLTAQNYGLTGVPRASAASEWDHARE